jgi:hypothetical protein
MVRSGPTQRGAAGRWRKYRARTASRDHIPSHRIVKKGAIRSRSQFTETFERNKSFEILSLRRGKLLLAAYFNGPLAGPGPRATAQKPGFPELCRMGSTSGLRLGVD